VLACRYAGSAVNAFGLVKFDELAPGQCFYWAGFYATVACFATTGAACAFAIFPTALLIVYFYRH